VPGAAWRDRDAMPIGETQDSRNGSAAAGKDDNIRPPGGKPLVARMILKDSSLEADFVRWQNAFELGK